MVDTPHRQLGIFGQDEPPPEMHVVAAHTRLRADGTEVYVAEHLRWNRGKTGPRSAARRADIAVPRGQLGLFYSG